MKFARGASEALNLALLAGLTAAFVFTASTAAMAGAWQCSAAKLKAYRYTGGDKAYIHLRPYGKGGWYAVGKTATGHVSGRTKDGTPFVCARR